MSNPEQENSAGFAGFELHPSVDRGVATAGFIDPRPIQTQTIPAALEGRDILGLAQTGTGKTAAFALPILEQILDEPCEGPQALIVAPTRELASQICEEIRLLARHTKITAVTLFGGVSAASQRAALRKNPDIIVACPGRLLDLHGQGVVHFKNITTLVLDEADHMFDMGFLPDIRRILAALPEDRQNMLFSATMPREIRHLADALLYEPLVVELNQDQPLETIEHALFSVENPSKFELLERVIAEDGFVSAIVFTRTKHRARKLARQLDSAGHQAVALQGNMSQNQRDRALNGFRAKKFDVLVATDIAARGLDIEQVSHVINFDMPTTPDAYTHRIGRTGRSERQGRAYTFVTPDDYALVQAVERRMGAAIPRQAFDGLGGAAVVVAARPDQERSSQRSPRRSGQGQGHGDGRRRRSGGGGNRGNGGGSNRRNGNRAPASRRA